MSTKSDSPLAKPGGYRDEYSPEILYPMPRAEGRTTLGIAGALPFSGCDIWRAHEISWLNVKGKPVFATGTLVFPADSPNIIESKSLKLYLNSLSSKRCDSTEEARSIIARDLSFASSGEVSVSIRPGVPHATPWKPLPGRCIDDTDIEVDRYDVDSTILTDSVAAGTEVSESVYSHLLKSNCPVTNQPDWASVLVSYRGPKIYEESLLAYLISYRNHAEFHEQCVERMFLDIARYCRPERLTIHARFKRRGGLDINPFRSNFEDESSVDYLATS